MKFIIKIVLITYFTLFGVPWQGSWAEAREVVDMAGRRVEIPDNPQRVYSPSPPGTVLLYVFDPGVMCSIFNMYGREQAGLLDPRVKDLPNIGTLSGDGATASLEKLLEAQRI